jgi:hypothetical protein
VHRFVLLECLVLADGTGKVATSTDQGGLLFEIQNRYTEHAQPLGHFNEVRCSSPTTHTGSISLLNDFLHVLVDAAYKEKQHDDDDGGGGVIDSLLLVVDCAYCIVVFVLS